MLYSCCAECGIADKYGKRGVSPFSCSWFHQMLSCVIWIAFFIVFTRKTKHALMLTHAIMCYLKALSTTLKCCTRVVLMLY